MERFSLALQPFTPFLSLFVSTVGYFFCSCVIMITFTGCQTPYSAAFQKKRSSTLSVSCESGQDLSCG